VTRRPGERPGDPVERAALLGCWLTYLIFVVVTTLGLTWLIYVISRWVAA
jgi:hypothetical protein